LKSKPVIRAGYKQIDSLLDGKIILITKDLSSNYVDRLYSTLGDNALSIVNFILSLKTEINLSNHHIKNNIMVLTLLPRFYSDVKSFKEMTREDVITFLDGARKSDDLLDRSRRSASGKLS
jgi:hypothetical protein